jgi:hypothetical protein
MSNFYQLQPIAEPLVEAERCTQPWYRWFFAINSLFNSGYTGTITTAALTSGGTQGSMSFTNGVLTARVAAT